MVLLLLLQSGLARTKEEKGFCVQIATSTSVESLKEIAQQINCSVAPELRIEKVGKYFVLRAGFWKSRKEGEKFYKKLKEQFPGSVFRYCLWNKERIVDSICKVERESKKERSKVSMEILPNANFTYQTFKDYDASLSLKELGYPNNLVLRGNFLKYTFYLPVLPQFKEGSFEVNMKISPSIPLEGRITVLINEIPYKTYYVSQLGYLSKVAIPVVPDRKTMFSKITLLFNFFPKENVCEVLNVKDAYVVIYNDSQFKIKLKEDYKPQDVLSYLLSYTRSLNLQGRSLYGLSQASYFIASLYKKFSLFNLNLSAPNGRKVVLTDGMSQIKEKELLLNPKDADAAKFLWPLRTSAYSAQIYSNPVKTGKFIPIKAFGFNTQTVEGIGNVVVFFNVPFYAFKGKPKKLMLLLRYAAQSVSSKSGDKLWVSLMVNNQLVWSRELYGSTAVQENLIEVPGYTLKFGKNKFSVVFSYYPGMDTCTGSVPSLRFTLYDSSAVSAVGVSKEYTSIREFLQSLSGRVGLVVDSGLSPHFVKGLFKLLGYYNPHADRLIPQPEEADFFIVVKPFNKITEKELPIHYDEKIKIVNPLTKQVVMKVNGSYNFLLFQLGKYRGAPALFVSPSNSSAQQVIDAIEWSDLERFLGNAVFLFKDSIYSFEIGKKFRVEYSRSSLIEYYLKKYRVIIFVFLFFFITLFIVYLWRRLT